MENSKNIDVSFYKSIIDQDRTAGAKKLLGEREKIGCIERGDIAESIGTWL